eukprot:TRINITY_DN670_c0_g1_i11.p5 TRINITY_DN670_c0_g1~~TRINITY_DN670_c0_g1_i11.p5  ORF type:complete len:147 (-),score=29.91 TRINITY_DN670_c0_g1_i11:465-905(-)
MQFLQILFEEDNVVSLSEKIRKKPIPPIPVKYSPELAELIMKMLNRNREERITAEKALKEVYNWFEENGNKEVELKELLMEKDLELKKVFTEYEICKKEWEEEKKAYEAQMRIMKDMVEGFKKENELKNGSKLDVCGNYKINRERS